MAMRCGQSASFQAAAALGSALQGDTGRFPTPRGILCSPLASPAPREARSPRSRPSGPGAARSGRRWSIASFTQRQGAGMRLCFSGTSLSPPPYHASSCLSGPAGQPCTRCQSRRTPAVRNERPWHVLSFVAPRRHFPAAPGSFQNSLSEDPVDTDALPATYPLLSCGTPCVNPLRKTATPDRKNPGLARHNHNKSDKNRSTCEERELGVFLF